MISTPVGMRMTSLCLREVHTRWAFRYFLLSKSAMTQSTMCAWGLSR